MVNKKKIFVKIDPRLASLIPGFLENRRADIQALHTALKENDWEKVRLLGHMMKGSGRGYGFDRITEIGGALEEAAKTSDHRRIKEQIRFLEDYLENLEIGEEKGEGQSEG